VNWNDIDRERRNVERRIRLARFPLTKSFDTFDFAAQPSLNKALLLKLMRCEWMTALRVGHPGPAKCTRPWGRDWPPAKNGYSVAFTTAAALVHELMEARDERRLCSTGSTIMSTSWR
jgi:DNA replication protein DnaC